MTLTLQLPRDLELRLTSEASRLGVPVEQVALRLLGELPEVAPRRPTNGAELVDYWRRKSVIGSRSDIDDSQVYARELRQRAERRFEGE